MFQVTCLWLHSCYVCRSLVTSVVHLSQVPLPVAHAKRVRALLPLGLAGPCLKFRDFAASETSKKHGYFHLISTSFILYVIICYHSSQSSHHHLIRCLIVLSINMIIYVSMFERADAKGFTMTGVGPESDRSDRSQAAWIPRSWKWMTCRTGKSCVLSSLQPLGSNGPSNGLSNGSRNEDHRSKNSDLSLWKSDVTDVTDWFSFKDQHALCSTHQASRLNQRFCQRRWNKLDGSGWRRVNVKLLSAWKSHRCFGIASLVVHHVHLCIVTIVSVFDFHDFECVDLWCTRNAPWSGWDAAQANPVALGRISQFLKACGALGVKQVGDPAEAEQISLDISWRSLERHQCLLIQKIIAAFAADLVSCLTWQDVGNMLGTCWQHVHWFARCSCFRHLTSRGAPQILRVHSGALLQRSSAPVMVSGQRPPEAPLQCCAVYRWRWHFWGWQILADGNDMPMICKPFFLKSYLQHENQHESAWISCFLTQTLCMLNFVTALNRPVSKLNTLQGLAAALQA